MVSNIVKGHKGVMDLDLDLVPKGFWKEAVKQHNRDIKEYNKGQDKLPERLRYENTILRIKKLHEIDEKAAEKINNLKYINYQTQRQKQ